MSAGGPRRGSSRNGASSPPGIRISSDWTFSGVGWSIRGRPCGRAAHQDDEPGVLGNLACAGVHRAVAHREIFPAATQ